MTDLGGMYYDESGGGEHAIVFLHYFGSAGRAWRPLVTGLGDSVRCIMPDLRGFGESVSRGPGFSVAHYANDVARLIRSLDLQRYVLAGHSMGGKIAMALAARHPEGLRSLVLFAPSPPTPEPMSVDAREELRQMFGDRKRIEAHLKRLCALPLPDDVLHQESTQHLKASAIAWNAWIDKGSREDISDSVSAISVPVLVIGGGADTGITPDLLKDEVAGRLPQSTLQILGGIGHLLPLERPAQIGVIMQDWLKKSSAD